MASSEPRFTPLLWQPPGIKAGCGGIDMYLGSFGFANTSQFVVPN